VPPPPPPNRPKKSPPFCWLNYDSPNLPPSPPYGGNPKPFVPPQRPPPNFFVFFELNFFFCPLELTLGKFPQEVKRPPRLGSPWPPVFAPGPPARPQIEKKIPTKLFFFFLPGLGTKQEIFFFPPNNAGPPGFFFGPAKVTSPKNKPGGGFFFKSLFFSPETNLNAPAPPPPGFFFLFCPSPCPWGPHQNPCFLPPSKKVEKRGRGKGGPPGSGFLITINGGALNGKKNSLFFFLGAWGKFPP